MIPRDHEAWHRAMGEAAALPADDPQRIAMQAEVSRLGPWAEAAWLALQQEGERWRLELARVEVPAGLEDRLLRIPTDAPATPLSRLLHPSLLARVSLAAGLVLAVGAWFLFAGRPTTPDPIEAVALMARNDHLETHDLDVRGTEAAAVATGLHDRIPFDIHFPALGESLRIEGGRRCTLGSHPVCFTTWRRDGARLTLLQLRRTDFGLPANLVPTLVTPRGAAAGAPPVDVLVWTEGEFGYALVSSEPSALRDVHPGPR